MDRILHRIANLINNKDQRIIVGISGHGASSKTTEHHYKMTACHPAAHNLSALERHQYD